MATVCGPHFVIVFEDTLCHRHSAIQRPNPLFTQKLQNGFLRHFFLFFCVAHFGRLQKLETTNVATSMFSP